MSTGPAAADTGDTISALRAHLFETIRSLRDDKAPMDLARAKTISDVAQTIINSAKVEVDYLRAKNGGESGFLNGNAAPTAPPLPPAPAAPSAGQNGITSVTRHLLKD